MMKKVYYLIVLLVMVVVFLKLKPEDFKEAMKLPHKLPETAKVIKYNTPLKCNLEAVEVIESIATPLEVKGSNYLKAWSLKFKTNQDEVPVYLVGTEEPLSLKTQLMTASNCSELKEDEVEALNLSYDCMGIWLWDKENYQISRQCGQVLGDNIYFNFNSKN
jgi:hypothetical protein